MDETTYCDYQGGRLVYWTYSDGQTVWLKQPARRSRVVFTAEADQWRKAHR